jgi:hypothetical protein
MAATAGMRKNLSRDDHVITLIYFFNLSKRQAVFPTLLSGGKHSPLYSVCTVADQITAGASSTLGRLVYLVTLCLVNRLCSTSDMLSK